MRLHFLAGALLSILLVSGPPVLARGEIIQTIAGGGPNGVPATSVEINATAILADPAGGCLLAAWNYDYYGRIYKLDTSGQLTHVAGAGRRRPASLGQDGVPAKQADLAGVYAMTLDPSGNLYLLDTFAGRIRRIDAATGALTTVGPDGLIGFGLARSPAGDLFVSTWDHRVSRIDAATGALTTIAGTGTPGFTGDGGPATSAQLSSPGAIAFDASGNLFIADSGNRRVRKIDALTGDISTVAGSGNAGFEGDGGPALNANFYMPYTVGLAFDSSGNLFIGDWVETGDIQGGGRIRRVDAVTGIVDLYAGGGNATGQGIQALGAKIDCPVVLDFDAAGDLLIADGCNPAGLVPPGSARKVVASTGLIYTIAGGGSAVGNGGPALDATLDDVRGVTSDAAGNVFFSEGMNAVRRVDASTGLITLVAGSGFGYNGDGILATSALLKNPRGVATGAVGLYIADSSNHRVRRVLTSSGFINTYAGNGTAGYSGDGMLASTARLNSPSGVALDAAGNLYIADTNNHRIRFVAAANRFISTFAGNGSPAFCCDGGPASEASLRSPRAVAVDSSGAVYIADTSNFRIRRVNPMFGDISTIAGNGTSGYSGDGGPATSASLGAIENLALDTDGNLLLVDSANHRVRKVNLATGIIDSVAGTGESGFYGDGGAPQFATLEGPGGDAVNPAGGYLIGDNRRIRRVTSTSAPMEAGSAGDDLTVAPAPFGMVTLSWSPSCHSGDSAYEIYEGTFGSFASHVPRTCEMVSGTDLTFTPAAGDAYYLVVPRSFAREGSYGLDSDGLQRPASLTACLPQQIAACP